MKVGLFLVNCINKILPWIVLTFTLSIYEIEPFNSQLDQYELPIKPIQI